MLLLEHTWDYKFNTFDSIVVTDFFQGLDEEEVFVTINPFADYWITEIFNFPL